MTPEPTVQDETANNKRRLPGRWNPGWWPRRPTGL